jgi:hypothetical protein
MQYSIAKFKITKQNKEHSWKEHPPQGQKKSSTTIQ